MKTVNRGIKATNIGKGMILEVIRLPDKECGTDLKVMGNYLVVTMITEDLMQRYKKPMMEIRLANGGFTNSALTFWSPTGGIFMHSSPGRKVPFKFKMKKNMLSCAAYDNYCPSILAVGLDLAAVFLFIKTS